MISLHFIGVCFHAPGLVPFTAWQHQEGQCGKDVASNNQWLCSPVTMSLLCESATCSLGITPLRMIAQIPKCNMVQLKGWTLPTEHSPNISALRLLAFTYILTDPLCSKLAWPTSLSCG